MLKKPATRKYPAVERKYHERTRGSVAIEQNDCILCAICVKKCPSEAIIVSRNKRLWMIVRMQCILCGSCVDACPKKCLFMKAEYTAPGEAKIVDYTYIPENLKTLTAEAVE